MTNLSEIYVEILNNINDLVVILDKRTKEYIYYNNVVQEDLLFLKSLLNYRKLLISLTLLILLVIEQLEYR